MSGNEEFATSLPIVEGEVRLIMEHGEPKGIRDRTGFLVFFHRVTKYSGQEGRYRAELDLRLRQADVLVTALRAAK
jgi:hypothetical protein